MCSLAVGDQQGARYRWSAWAPRQHSTRLHPALAAALAELGWTPAEAARRLAAVAVTTGPGSFTGLRIGIATAMGLSHAWGLPLVGVSTLLILAHAAGPRPGPVAAAIPTPRGECYAALFRPGAAGAPPEQVGEVFTGSPAAALDHVRSLLPEGGPPHLVGAGWEPDPAAPDPGRKAGDGAQIYQLPAGKDLAWPSAVALADVAARRIAAGVAGDARPEFLRPLYVRRPGLGGVTGPEHATEREAD